MPRVTSKSNKKKNNEKVLSEDNSSGKIKSKQKPLNTADDSDLLSSGKVLSAIDWQDDVSQPTEDQLIKSVELESKKEPYNHPNLKTSDHRSELDLLMEDVRESLKDKSLIDSASQVLPGSAYQGKKDLPKPLQKVDTWFSENFRDPYSTIGYRKIPSSIRILIISSFIIVILFLLFLVSRALFPTTPTIVSTNTPVPTFAIPEPYSLELPGGWTFLLKVSKVVYPDWKPTQAEWLKDTVICKLIAIPWNIQIDAVYKTIVKGDVIKLTLDNKDQYPYKVDSTKMVSKDKLIELINSNSPCMIIFLYKESATSWQVLSALPSEP
jgi:signal peptidase I